MTELQHGLVDQGTTLEATLREGVTSEDFLTSFEEYQVAAAAVGVARKITSYERSGQVIGNDISHAIDTRRERRQALSTVLRLVDMPEVTGLRKRSKRVAALGALASDLYAQEIAEG